MKETSTPIERYNPSNSTALGPVTSAVPFPAVTVIWARFCASA
jgi:hypothetical protein